MDLTRFPRTSFQNVGIEGLLLTFSPVPFMLAVMMGGESQDLPPLWRLSAAVVAGLACVVTAFFLLRRPRLGRFFGYVSLAGSTVAIIPFFESNPRTVFVGATLIISAGYALAHFRLPIEALQRARVVDRSLQRVYWSAMTLVGLTVSVIVFDQSSHVLLNVALVGSTGVTILLLMHWFWRRFLSHIAFSLSLLSTGVMGGIVIAYMHGYARLSITIFAVLVLILLPGPATMQESDESWWMILLGHPARVLLGSFLGLCLLGALLLLIPDATTGKGISLVDSAFTSVSAVCITGLIVLDTPHDFTVFGQALILGLIQLGGLGIMSIATVGLQAMGRRLSLSQERLMTTMTDTDHLDLVASLVFILRFTFIVEGIGAFLLAGLFYFAGSSPGTAIWNGVFTAVSAFCNAGFSLKSDNLASFHSNPVILYVVSLLIIFGGLAPATSLLIPRWLKGRSVPVRARLALTTTAVLIVGGTLMLLIIEWNGILAGLSVGDKIHNAWFQSVTLRTAGFNSVDLTGIKDASYLLMICFMFIGGSPGGTAGGVKTTTIAILVMTFWASVTGRTEVVIQRKRIPPPTIYRAVTIVSSGAMVWLGMGLMLEMTQPHIPARQLLYEITSALGTVGLSIGATAQLDTVGKIIVMVAMFVGRIGPMTMFMLLSEDHSVSVSRCLDAKISLT